jgi:hypothetical protein
MTVGVTWVDAAQVVTAAAGLIVAGLVAVMPHLRRPKLRIEEERDKANSRVEASIMGGMPHVRILVRNAKRRRAAKGTRVLIEGYRPKSDPGATITTLGHPSLDWPSTGEGPAPRPLPSLQAVQDQSRSATSSGLDVIQRRTL